MDANELKAALEKSLRDAGLKLTEEFDYDYGYKYAISAGDGTSIELGELFANGYDEWPHSPAPSVDLEELVGQKVTDSAGREYLVERAAE